MSTNLHRLRRQLSSLLAARSSSSPRRRRHAAKLLGIGMALLISHGAFLFHGRYISSGFFFARRFGELIAEAADPAVIDLWAFRAAPATPFYALTMSQVTGLQVETVVYLPVFVTIPLLWYYVFSRDVLGNEVLAALLAIAIMAWSWTKVEHFSQYTVAMTLFVLFLWQVHRAIMSGAKRDWVIVIGFALIIKGFSAHSEVWVVSFFVIVTILFTAQHRYRRRVNDQEQKRAQSTATDGGRSVRQRIKGGHQRRSMLVSRLAATTLLLIVILFWFNSKFYSGLLVYTTITSPISSLVEFFTRALQSSATTALTYAPGAHSPPLPRRLNIVYLLLTGLVFAGSAVVVLAILADEGDDYLLNGDSAIVWGSGMASYFPDHTLMLFAGRLPVNFLRVTGVILPLGLVAYSAIQTSRLRVRQTLQTLTVGTVLVVVVIALASQAAFVAYDIPANTPPEAQTDAAASWLTNHSSEHPPTRILTDLNTFGLLRVSAAELTGDGRKFFITPYTDPRYAYLIGDNPTAVRATREIRARYGTPTPPSRFDYVTVSWTLGTEPLKRGSPDWRSFERLTPHRDEIRGNPRVNHVFATGDYSIYYPQQE